MYAYSHTYGITRSNSREIVVDELTASSSMEPFAFSGSINKIYVK